MANDERKFFLSGELCSHDEVAFVLAIFIVNDDYHFAARNCSEHFGNGSKPIVLGL